MNTQKSNMVQFISYSLVHTIITPLGGGAQTPEMAKVSSMLKSHVKVAVKEVRMIFRDVLFLTFSLYIATPLLIT